MTKNREQIFEDYMKNCDNTLAERILEDIQKCKEEERWKSLTTDKEKKIFIDNNLIEPGIIKKYAHVKVEHKYENPILHTHRWFTKSQLDLFQNLPNEYKYPLDNESKLKTDDIKKSSTMPKKDDKFKQDLINELKLKQFSNDQINMASQKANNVSIINKIKNKVNATKVKINKDLCDDRQNLVDVKAHQIVPSKPKAPPPPPPLVKIKVTPVNSPTGESNTSQTMSNDKSKTQSHSTISQATPKIDIKDVKAETIVVTHPEGKTKHQTKIHKSKKMPAPPPPVKPKPVQVEVKKEDINVDANTGNSDTTLESMEFLSASSATLNSPSKSFCSLDDNIPKTGFDFLDNW